MRVAPALERYGDFAAFPGGPEVDSAPWQALRRAETTGRPLGARSGSYGGSYGDGSYGDGSYGDSLLNARNRGGPK
ncbi:hypothetical protein DBR17_19505 [Sphingomonas sp. HMWF008]|nr:hypothetical protein DBR17_19505 [Sphingomonas sp. HMWF008]